MIITCPECATRYSANASAIGPNGKTVRCAKCSATWFVSADPEVMQLTDIESPAPVAKPASAPEASPVPKDMPGQDSSTPAGAMAAAALRDKADRAKSRRRLMGVSMVWVVTLVLLALMALAAYLLRHQIVERFPAASSLYKAVGIEVKLGGITFQGVETKAAMVDGTPTLMVSGQLHNPDRNSHNIKPVRFVLLNSGEEPLAEWMMDPPSAALPAKARQPFTTQYPNPPIDAVILRYGFEDAIGAVAAPQAAPAQTPQLSTLQASSDDGSTE